MLRVLRKSPYKVRRVGARGTVIAVPNAYVAKYDIRIGDEALACEDEKGRLVLIFDPPKDGIVATDHGKDRMSGVKEGA